jgi:hypothetical protein
MTVAATNIFGPLYFNFKTSLFDRTQAVDCVAMGVMIAGAATVRTVERYETRRASPDRSVSALLRTFGACAIALAICVAVLSMSAPVGTLAATGFGVVALTSVVLIRRLGLGSWGIAAIALPVVAIAGFLAASEPDLNTKGFSLAFATEAPASQISMSQRILGDAPLRGTGAGTFAAIAPIYRDIEDQTAVFTAPNAAAAIAIELGRPMLWLIVATMAGSIYVLLRASLRRGRDSFYPTAGASCLITLSLLSFMNVEVLGSAAAMIAASTLGLAFAQSKSRTVREQ